MACLLPSGAMTSARPIHGYRASYGVTRCSLVSQLTAAGTSIKMFDREIYVVHCFHSCWNSETQKFDKNFLFCVLLLYLFQSHKITNLLGNGRTSIVCPRSGCGACRRICLRWGGSGRVVGGLITHDVHVLAMVTVARSSLT